MCMCDEVCKVYVNWCTIYSFMHYVSVMKIRKIRELQLTNVRTLLIQVRLGPNIYMHSYNNVIANYNSYAQ